jgi:hypothetical protein
MRTMLLLLIVCVGGCGAYRAESHVDALKTRAAFDLKCPEGSVQAAELATNSWGVRCAGQQGTYLWDYPHQVWVMNSEGHTATAK